MKSNISSWYASLGSNKKLLVHFVLQWLYWAFAWWIYKNAWPDERPAKLGEILFHATWMAAWMTMFFSWKKVKALFTKKKHHA